MVKLKTLVDFCSKMNKDKYFVSDWSQICKQAFFFVIPPFVDQGYLINNILIPSGQCVMLYAFHSVCTFS